MADDAPTSKPVVDRSKICPFLLRAFVKIGGHHRLSIFEDNVLPVADEYQLYTWNDATLRELVTALRALPPNPLTSSLRHGAARFSFRAVFPDPTDRGRISYKDLGTIHARDLTQINLLEGDFETEQGTDELERRGRIEEKDKKIAEERTIEELRVQPGDWLDVAVMVPTSTGIPSASGSFGAGGPSIRGAAATRGAGRGIGILAHQLPGGPATLNLNLLKTGEEAHLAG
ncbi:Sin3 associated polypeptide p18-domain-containing protein [Cantharellus anzutake]|uniref:Sin3 associated polypeptide p18-domain-containing protein n=1 Tax=Cantharellus anzutake TaxID=1750568 RepID=UPI0019071AEE|nr:Sin3 associated polypeptide p18-domain-containing protein [Cantharellus anzutake]KAF8324570.1 Sin3 associated polypeptide p18-domain-containing protein [Cantharellus anzutake]